ncbi:RasGEF domain-containing protein [uncultured Legionella sp.]|uniref:RasGEF domain-containing protein n=1 Tax=uncultured Legionella sp. TaxID=210934 RepID=UPI0026269D31|nr:RasGEF domain-containing protein [uncultured Legionella sp.]
MSQHNKSEVKSSFIRWYYKSSVLFSSHPSKAWDEKMADPIMDVAIASSREVKRLCKKTEAKITAEYVDLLDFQIRDAFQKLNRSDIANPSGFSNIERASPELEHFFQCRKIFEKFIADDICGHSDKNAQIRAFTRWVSITNSLLKRHNYDAACMVLLRLSQIDTRLHLDKNLPESTQKKLHYLNTLISPSKNFKAMRDYIRSHHSQNDLPPTFLMSKDMTFLNEALGDDKNLASNEITKEHPSYSNIVRKEQILDGLFNKKKGPKACSGRLTALFKAIREEYLQQQLLSVDDNLPPRPERQKQSADVIPLSRVEQPLPDTEQSGSSSKLMNTPGATDEATVIKETEEKTTEQKQSPKHSERPQNYAKNLFNLSFFSSSEYCVQEVIRTVVPLLKF